MSELGEHAILYNTAALTSLKRAQLVSLSKRYGLKASGKNTEIVQRLYDFGKGLTPGAQDVLHAAIEQNNESPTKHLQTDNNTSPEALAPLPQTSIKSLPSSRTIGRPSEAWEVITTGDSSLIEDSKEETIQEEEPQPETEQTSLSTRSWKSADNGAPLDDFGTHKQHELRGVGSLRSLASSIRRTASRTLSSRHKDTRPDCQTVFPADGMEDAPPSPASTIGVPKRHPEALHHRPSTIRLISPSPAETFAAIQRAASPEPDDALPLTGQNTVDRIRQRASNAPLRGEFPPVTLHNKRSLPTILSPPSTKTGIYPALPTFKVTSTDREMLRSDSPEMPGSFPASPRSPAFVFGADQGPSNAEFSDVGAKLLEEMQSKLNGTGSAFKAELLKGKNAELTKLVNVNSDLGRSAGGWGLSSGPTEKDRYADSHQREFSRMKSLRSSTETVQGGSHGSVAGKRKLDTGASLSNTVNGLPVAAPQEDSEERGSKRARTTVPAPRTRYFSSLRKSTKSPVKGSTLASSSMLRSVRGSHTTGRFGFLRHKRTASKGSPDSVTSDGEYVLPAASVPIDGTPAALLAKKSSTSQSKRASTLLQPTAASMSKSLAPAPSHRRGPIPDFDPSKPTYQPLIDHSAEAGPSSASGSGSSRASQMSGRPKSTMSTASSMSTLSRSTGKHDLARIASAEFKASMAESPGILPAPISSLPKSGSRVSIRPSSVSSRPTIASRSSASSRKSNLPRSGSSMLASTSSTRPSTLSRSGSTLLAPTASSRARMQATVQPPATARRPLPHPPKQGLAGITTVTPFGEGSSRANHLFESNFHLQPLQSPFASPRKAVTSPVKRPLPHTPSAARRARASGIVSVKSSMHHDTADVARRRAEMRAKHERLTQERDLRRMLG